MKIWFLHTSTFFGPSLFVLQAKIRIEVRMSIRIKLNNPEKKDSCDLGPMSKRKSKNIKTYWILDLIFNMSNKINKF